MGHLTNGTTPVSSLHADEIGTATKILREAGLAGTDVRFSYMGLLEPAKADVLAYVCGTGPRPVRRARAILLNIATGESNDVEIDLDRAEIAAVSPIDGSRGRAPILPEELFAVGAILGKDESWAAALAKRGLTPDGVMYAPLSAGAFDIPGERDRRIIRVLTFAAVDPDGHAWSHPVDGLSAYVDTIADEVVQIIDEGVFPLSDEVSAFHRPEGRPDDLTTLKPIEITQPEGPSFTVEGDRITWANWSFNYGFDSREGLVLHNLAFADPDHDGEVRPIIYRASIAEMVVPYGDPAPSHFWQNYFDTGEYIYGKLANSLTLGCDCLGEIHYTDAVVVDEFGNPRTIPNAICLHEEDYGTLWKHTDDFTPNSAEVRRQRRLVISFFTTVGNYDYGFYWYLYLDGKIECEAKLTGIVFTTAYRGWEEHPYATEVAPGVGAPVHQHLFGARLDMMIDGVKNAVDEIDVVRLSVSETNPYGNAFTNKTTRLRSESEAVRETDGSVARQWLITSAERTNRVGRPTGYMLHAEHLPMLLADPSASIARRATFTSKSLWVTQYAADERYPAGEFVNQNPGGDGLPAYIQGDRPVDGQDIVVWHTFGVTHFPRPEDWPVMPVDYAGFSLKPFGFFDRNPALNVPPNPPKTGGHCCA